MIMKMRSSPTTNIVVNTGMWCTISSNEIRVNENRVNERNCFYYYCIYDIISSIM